MPNGKGTIIFSGIVGILIGVCLTYVAIQQVFVTPPEPSLACIQPPLSTITEQRAAAVSIGVELEKLFTSSNIKEEFQSILKRDFKKLTDANDALLLFLNAIDCYLQRGDVGEEIAMEMALKVYEWWGSANGFSGVGSRIVPAESSVIDESKSADMIYARLRQFGIERE